MVRWWWWWGGGGDGRWRWEGGVCWEMEGKEEVREEVKEGGSGA